MVAIPFLSAWVIMLCLGAIGHQFNLPQLFTSYWVTLAICILLIVPFKLIRYALGRDRGGDK